MISEQGLVRLPSLILYEDAIPPREIDGANSKPLSYNTKQKNPN
ncbi:hypothetical protein K3495_g13331 [Podosphaera aphanis]|nr:hypothetical protein K3495_g13331 [Podosphaera aphanis]